MNKCQVCKKNRGTYFWSPSLFSVCMNCYDLLLKRKLGKENGLGVNNV